MDIDKVTLAEIFERPRRYLVPLFQRPYVWSEEQQWQPLWDDIVNQAETLVHARVTGSRKPRLHFLGAVVLGREPTIIRQVPISLLVDGQQRLTTTQVLLAALRDVAQELGGTFLLQKLLRLTRNPEPLQEKEEVYKVWPTNADQAAFEAAMTVGSPSALEAAYPVPKRKKKGLRPPLVEAYLFFSEAIWLYLEDKEARPAHVSATATHLARTGPEGEWMSARAELLFEAVVESLQLVSIELSPDEDPQVIFETLNARGVPLRPADLVRNYLFLAANRQREPLEQLYDRFWAPFDDLTVISEEKKPFWKEEIKQGRFKRTRLDLFVFHYTTLMVAHEIRIDHLFIEFRSWWEGDDHTAPVRSVPAELARLARHAGHFRLLQVPDSTTRVGQFTRRLKALDTSTVYPLALALLDRRKDIGEDELGAIFTVIESYLVRRMVCGLTAKGYNRIFLALLKKLLDSDEFSRVRVREELTALGSGDAWPTDEAFRHAWQDSPVYARLGPAKIRMILEALELSLRTAKQEPLPLQQVLTIEHLLPQNPSVADYPYAPLPAGFAATPEVLRERRVRLIHAMGNLTLLTQELNSSVSNGPWTRKRAEIAGQSLLRLNAAFQHPDMFEGWDEASVTLRGAELFNRACQIWPGPSLAIQASGG